MVDTGEFDELQRSPVQRGDQWLHLRARRLAIGVRAGEQHRRVRGDSGRHVDGVDRIGFDDGLDVAGVDDRAQSIREINRHRPGGADLLDRGPPGGEHGIGLLLGLAANSHRRLDIGPDPAGNQVEVARGERLQQPE